MLKLQYKENSRSIWLVGPRMRLGTNGDNDVVLSGAGVSPYHAELLIDGDDIKLKVLDDSLCSINGEPVSSLHPLKLGDELGLGARYFLITDPKQEVENRAPIKPELVKTQQAASREGQKVQASGVGSGWILQASHRSLKNKRYPINGTVVVGRSPDCDLSFSYDRLSRRHAELEENGGTLFVKDLESSNGTYVNGNKVSHKQLHAGDVVSFDKLSFTVEGPRSGNTQDQMDALNRTVVTPINQPQNDSVENTSVMAAPTGGAANEASEPAKKSSPAGLIALVFIVAIGAAAAWWFLGR